MCSVTHQIVQQAAIVMQNIRTDLLYCGVFSFFFFFKSLLNYVEIEIAFRREKRCQEKRKDLIQYYLFLYGALMFRP